MANPIQKNDLISDDALRALEEMSRLLREDKENMDALMASFKQYAGSIQTATTANNGNNDALAAALQKVSELEKAYSDLQKAMKENAATQKAINAEKRKYAKLTEEEATEVKNLRTELKWLNDEDKEVASYVKKKIEAINAEKMSYNQLQQTYNAVRDALNKMTPEQLKSTEAGKLLAAQGLKIRDAMNEMQKATGNYTLQVGKYRAAFDGLGYSMQQILREAPSALNLNQFFLAISNNIPMFTDQLKAFRDEQKEIRANLETMTKGTKEYAEQLSKVETVAQKLGRTLMSWQTLVLVGLLVLRNLPKIVEWVKTLFKKVDDGLNRLREMRRIISDINISVQETTSKAKVELEEINRRMLTLTKDTTEWANAVARVNEITGSTLDNITATPEQVRKVTDAYLQQAEQLAKNKYVIDKIAESADNQFRRNLANTAMSVDDQVNAILGNNADKEAEEKLKKRILKIRGVHKKLIETEWGSSYVDETPEERQQRIKKDMEALYNEYGLVVRTADELKSLWETFYVPLPTNNNNGSGSSGDKQFDFSPSDVDDEYWKAEQARIRMMEKGYDMEIDLQRVKHEEMLEQNDVWQGKREEQLMDNLMGELTLLTNGNEKAAEQMYNAIVNNDTEAVKKMSAGAQQLAAKFWSDMEEGERQHDLIMQGLIIDNNEAIKAINMKYDKERMKQIEEESERELRVVKRRARTALQEKQRDEDLIHNIEVLIEEQRRLTTENYKEADSMEEASKKAEKLRKEIKNLQNQVDHSKRLSTKNSLTEIIKNFAIDNTSLGTARKSAEQRLGKDAYKAYDVSIKAAEENQLRAAESYGKESDEYKKATKEVADANDALKNAISKDWETIIANTVSGIEEWGSQMISLYQEMIQAEIDLANAKVEAAEKATEAAQEEYDKEKALLEAGYASRVEATWAEYQEKKAAQEKAEADAKAAAQRAKDLETAQQAINMVGASIDTYKAFAGIPVVGPALGAAAVAAMWTLFISAKAKAAEVSKYGEGGFEVLEGGSHASGHDIDLGVRNRRGRRMKAEGKEGIGIFSVRAMNHYGDRNIEGFVNSINRLEFEGNAAKRMSLERSVGMAVLSAPRTDLRRLENSVDKLVGYGSRSRTVNADGSVTEYRKNGKVTIKKG